MNVMKKDFRSMKVNFDVKKITQKQNVKPKLNFKKEKNSKRLV